nr:MULTISPECIES: isoprenyl transferase [unclassified Clostridium]
MREETKGERNMEENLKIPAHVALILDGNGRWAKKRGLPRQLGHKKGCETLEQVVEDAARLGIRYLTVYGFSTENWKRPEEEVGALMQLFRFYAKRLLAMAEKNNIRVRMIGERNRFASDLIEAINGLEEKTKDNTGMTFVIAVNYGSRDEITRAVRKIMTDAKEGKLAPEEMTEKVFSSYLDTAGIPDPDLMIRTSGELRLSNYLLWQLAYSELYVTECLWPDFNKEELLNAIRQYNKRERRFGGVAAVKTE